MLNNLPSSGELTLDPIIPERYEETVIDADISEIEDAADIPQGGDEPDRLDAIAPKKGLGKFFGK